MSIRTKILIEDMLDTMYEAMGVGLAAPQVGVLKRIVVIDVGEGPIILINPEILETSGEQTGEEGCLSVPGKCGQVTRPNYVKVSNGKIQDKQTAIDNANKSIENQMNTLRSHSTSEWDSASNRAYTTVRQSFR